MVLYSTSYKELPEKEQLVTIRRRHLAEAISKYQYDFGLGQVDMRH